MGAIMGFPLPLGRTALEGIGAGERLVQLGIWGVGTGQFTDIWKEAGLRNFQLQESVRNLKHLLGKYILCWRWSQVITHHKQSNSG